VWCAATSGADSAWPDSGDVSEGGGFGGGGGTPLPSGQRDESRSTWNDFGILNPLLGGGTEDPWDKPKNIDALLGLPPGTYKATPKRERKALRHQAKFAFTVQREQRQGDTQGLAKVLARLGGPVAALKRSAEFWTLTGPERKRLEAAARAGAVVGTVGAAPRAQPVPSPPGGTGRPPVPVQGDAVDSLLDALVALREWWLERERRKEEERAARRARRAQGGSVMGLGDVLAGLGGTVERVVSAAAPVAQAIFAERAARELRRGGMGMTVASAGPPGMSALVAPAVAPGAVLGPLLGGGVLGGMLGGQPGTLEEGGILETFETDLEREAVFWRRGTGASVRPVREIFARHPVTGALRTWEYRGQPILYSGDLAVCKRVNKIARRSAGRVGLRFRPRRRR
jgi:hypothetical protein